MFADPGGAPAVRPAPQGERLLPRGSVAFDVHADVTTMMAGGIAALLLQMLHPHALAGVW
ncbi:MAG: oxygenase MpaB family protein, partial [Sphingomonadaceae bacterium]